MKETRLSQTQTPQLLCTPRKEAFSRVRPETFLPSQSQTQREKLCLPTESTTCVATLASARCFDDCKKQEGGKKTTTRKPTKNKKFRYSLVGTFDPL